MIDGLGVIGGSLGGIGGSLGAIGFSTPLGLLALLAVPLILFLHLFRRRFRERRVAGLFLFAADALPARAGRMRTRLLQTPSLWLELLAAVCLALLLGGLTVGASAGRAHLVVVLDDSASMGAVVDGVSATERARDRVRALLDDLGPDAVVTLVRTGRRPEVLVGPRAPKGLAAEALEAWAPAQAGHDVSLALALGLDLADGGHPPVYVTDRDDAPPPRYRLIAVGRAAPNAALVSARRALRGEEERVLADIQAWGGARPLVVTLTAEAGAGVKEVARQEARVEPGQTLRLAFRVPKTYAALRVRLSDDALAIDNEALLLPERRAVVPVAIDLPDDAASALRLRRVLEAAGGVRLVDNEESQGDGPPALVFGAEASAAPRAAVLDVVVAPSGEETDAWVGPYLIERRHALGGGTDAPLLQGVSLDGVIWSAGTEPVDGLPLVLAGEQVLLAEQVVGGRLRLRLNLDPLRSNLPASPDWPVLVTNIVAATRTRLPGPLAPNVTLGQEIAWRVPGDGIPPDGLALVGPGGARRPARGFGVVTWEALRAGLHRLIAGSGDDERELALYAARFLDPGESNIQAATQLDRPAEERGRAREGREGDEEASGLEARLLLLLLLLAVAADWYWLGRRA